MNKKHKSFYIKDNNGRMFYVIKNKSRTISLDILLTPEEYRSVRNHIDGIKQLEYLPEHLSETEINHIYE